MRCGRGGRSCAALANMLCGRTKRAVPRDVYANDRAGHNSQFVSNRISNTKYTWWNFVFKNLWEQFR